MAIVAASFDLEVYLQRDKVVTATMNIHPSFAATLGKDAIILDAVVQLITVAVPGQADAQKLAEDSLFRLRQTVVFELSALGSSLSITKIRNLVRAMQHYDLPDV
jgi:hypothetical protein